MLTIQFVQCDSTQRDTCKTDEDINRWLSRKFIYMISNDSRFVTHLVEGDERTNELNSIINETKLSWIPVNTQIRAEHAFAITSTHLELEDNPFLQLGNVSANE